MSTFRRRVVWPVAMLRLHMSVAVTCAGWWVWLPLPTLAQAIPSGQEIYQAQCGALPRGRRRRRGGPIR